MFKRRREREPLVLNDIDTILIANRLLDEFEAVRRSRLDRFAETVAEADEGADE